MFILARYPLYGSSRLKSQILGRPKNEQRPGLEDGKHAQYALFFQYINPFHSFKLSSRMPACLVKESTKLWIIYDVNA